MAGVDINVGNTTFVGHQNIKVSSIGIVIALFTLRREHLMPAILIQVCLYEASLSESFMYPAPIRQTPPSP